MCFILTRYMLADYRARYREITLVNYFVSLARLIESNNILIALEYDII